MEYNKMRRGYPININQEHNLPLNENKEIIKEPEKEVVEEVKEVKEVKENEENIKIEEKKEEIITESVNVGINPTKSFSTEIIDTLMLIYQNNKGK